MFLSCPVPFYLKGTLMRDASVGSCLYLSHKVPWNPRATILPQNGCLGSSWVLEMMVDWFFLQQAYQFGQNGSVLRTHVVCLLLGPVISKSSETILLTAQTVYCF
uniref:Uncharacterized protein n=1 Tax=Arundo donax TaxID=35708 RepID=A0A0A9CTW3_ARUDO